MKSVLSFLFVKKQMNSQQEYSQQLSLPKKNFFLGGGVTNFSLQELHVSTSPHWTQWTGFHANPKLKAGPWNLKMLPLSPGAFKSHAKNLPRHGTKKRFANWQVCFISTFVERQKGKLLCRSARWSFKWEGTGEKAFRHEKSCPDLKESLRKEKKWSS